MEGDGAVDGDFARRRRDRPGARHRHSPEAAVVRKGQHHDALRFLLFERAVDRGGNGPRILRSRMWHDVTETVGEKERAGALARTLEGVIQQARERGRLLRIPGAAEWGNVDGLHGSETGKLKHAPPSGNWRGAIGATAARRDSVSGYPESAALDQQAGASRAAGVFEARGLTRQ